MKSVSASKNTTVFWQSGSDEGIGEPAVMMIQYADVLELNQEGRHVNISLADIPDFIRAIRKAVEE